MSKDSTITWGFSMVVITNWRQWQRCKEGDERRTRTTVWVSLLSVICDSWTRTTTWLGVESGWERLALEAFRGSRTLGDSRLKTKSKLKRPETSCML